MKGTCVDSDMKRCLQRQQVTIHEMETMLACSTVAQNGLGLPNPMGFLFLFLFCFFHFYQFIYCYPVLRYTAVTCH